ncbi:ABC transporter substrate-binding protein [Geodermatophilus sp. FMUSA9-8]|uniref:ABC transporter substrate-binding protein n=1 Tax=Geodermatophilus sp. FMUSA9-8 TaxID=3120155 RepID=UPI0030085FFF
MLWGRTARGRVAGAVAAVAVLAGCGSTEAGAEGAAEAPASADTRTVAHAAGTTEVTGSPERVVVLDTGELDAVLALGVTPVGAVRTDVSDELPGFVSEAGVDPADIAAVGTIAEPDLEAIAALEPDLILSNSVRHADLYDQLAQVAPTVFAEAIGESWQENLLLAGEALDREEQARDLLEEFAARAEEVGGRYGDPAQTEVSVARFLDGTLIRLYGEGSFIGSVLAEVGFARPELQRTSETFVEVSPEQVTSADGDLLFYGAYGADGATAAEQVTAGPLWASIPAVAEDRAVAVDDDRWFLGLGPLGAGLVLDDLEELAPQLAG